MLQRIRLPQPDTSLMPFRLGDTDRVEMLTLLHAKVRTSCRTDNKKWLLDLAAIDYAVTPNPIPTGEARQQAYAMASARIGEEAAELAQRQADEKEAKKKEAFAKLAKMAADRKAANAGVVVIGTKTQIQTIGVAPTARKRANWNGYCGTPLACWMHTKGWKIEDALKVFSKIGLTPSVQTITQAIKYGIRGIIPAKVTAGHEKELLTMLVK